MFSKRLNQTRKACGFTAQSMADYLAVTIRTYRNYESGHSEPNYDLLVQIADRLDVSLDYLLCRDEYLARKDAAHD